MSPSASPPPDLSALPRHDVTTSRGAAQVRILRAQGSPRGTLLLGHGAGGARDAADVRAVSTLQTQGWTVVLVDQPWRVAGRKVATPPPTLDEAWREVLEVLVSPAGAPDGMPLPEPFVYGGRSAGARVACRTSLDAEGAVVPGVVAVVCLAFPLHPPGRPERSRLPELLGPAAAGLPTLVVNGTRDPMGSAEEIAVAVEGRPLVQVHAVPGTHSPSRDLHRVTAFVADFLAPLGSARVGAEGRDASVGPDPTEGV